MTISSSYSRFKTRVIQIGNIPMGGDYPVRVQSMTNTDTRDVKRTVEQTIRMINAGCEYVRIAVPGMKEVESLREIKKVLQRKGYKTPLIADVHFNPKIAEIAATFVEKVRINPGNYLNKKKKFPAGKQTTTRYEEELEDMAKRLEPLIGICKKHNTAIRIGTNHGSLSGRILDQYGDTPLGMVESALEFVRICEALQFQDLVLSMKSSNTRVMIRANRMLVERMKKEKMNFPIHLGVTEAGNGEEGRLKSAIGIGSLLIDGIGDTIRVSITEDPEYEISVAYGILQATGTRITKTEFISCPSCARTLFNIQEAVEKIKSRTSHLTGVKIAIMGCIVNGPGEMADADYGYVGAGKGLVMLYKGEKLVAKNIPEAVAVDELIHIIKMNGDWVEPRLP